MRAAFAKRPWLEIVERAAAGADGADADADGADERPQVELCEYEEHDWPRVLSGSLVADAYIVRKGLQRKAQLATYLRKYTDKHPDSALAAAVPETHVVNMWEAFGSGSGTARDLGMSRAAAVDMCLAGVAEAMEGTAHLGAAGGTADEAAERWWIVKPSLTNKGAEIAVVEDVEGVKEAVSGEGRDVMEWVVQRYVPRPLLVAGRKFHLRVYVLGVGSLKVYVYTRILALFAVAKYGGSRVDDSFAHLTNTAHQASHAGFDYDKYVRLMSELPRMLAKQGVADAAARIVALYADIRAVVAHLFAAFRGEFGGFMPMDNAHELFGLDFLVTADFKPVLLEVNCRPDVKQTGTRLGGIIDDLCEGMVQLAVDAHPTVAPAARAWLDSGEAPARLHVPEWDAPLGVPLADDGVTRLPVEQDESEVGAAALFDLVYAQEAAAGAAPTMVMHG